MTDAQIMQALQRGYACSVLVRSGGWIGRPPQTLLLERPAGMDEFWAVTQFSCEGVHLRTTYVQAGDILAVSVRYQESATDAPE